MERGGTANADFAHLARDERGVRTDAAARGGNAFGRNHAAEVFGRSFDADEEHFFLVLRGKDGAIRVEINLAGGGPRTGGKTFGDDFGVPHRGAVEDRGE